MDKFTQMKTELLGQELVKHLKKRHIEAIYCKTAEDAKNLALEMIKPEESVTWGGSMSIRDIGLTKALVERNAKAVDRDTITDASEIQKAMRDAFSMDWYLTSANAISAKGEIVNRDGTGNRVAAISFGPKNVLFVIGMNKVEPDLHSAMKRAKHVAGAINSMRFEGERMCKHTGMCHDCILPDSICSILHVVRISKPAGRIKVILVEENLGF